MKMTGKLLIALAAPSALLALSAAGADRASPRDAERGGAKDAAKARDAKPRREDFRPPDTVEMKVDLVYGKGGGQDLKLDLLLPKEQAKDSRPAILVIHGGGWVSGDKVDFRALASRFAEKGYVAASINYRLTPDGVFPSCVEDAKCSVRWMRANAKEYGVDPDRIAAYGFSAGGHLAAMLGTVDKDASLEGNGGHEAFSSKVNAVVAVAAPTDIAALAQSAGKGARNGLLLVGARDLKTADRKRMEQASPVFHVDAKDPPFLVCHGTADETVPYAQAEALWTKLKEARVPVEFQPVANGSHAQGKAQELAEAFLEVHMPARRAR